MVDIAKIFDAGDVETFLGLPKGDLESLQPGIAILGVPLATPYDVTGDYAAGSPQAIRKAMATYAAARSHFDFDVGGEILPDKIGTAAQAHDYGDLTVSESDFASNRASIAETIKRIRAAGAIPVVMGGDDSIPIPVLEGYRDCASLHILQFDAHIDWRDEVNGERFGLSSNMRRASEMAQVTGITQVGARGIGSARRADRDAALDWGAQLFPMPELKGAGFAEVLATLPSGGELFINLDVDALDPSEMPAVIGPAPGGLRYREVVSLMAQAAARCRIAGFALTEFFPARDSNGLAALTAGRLICNALALIARQAR